jgi:hypothetical protein
MSDKPWLTYKKKINAWALGAIVVCLAAGVVSAVHTSAWGFISNAAAGLIGVALAVIVGLGVIGKYDTMRLTRPWVPSSPVTR